MSLQPLNTQNTPKVHPDQKLFPLSMLGNSVVGLLGNIPGATMLSNIVRSIPGMQSVYTQLGLIQPELPAARAPRIPQISGRLPESPPDHIAIDIPPEEVEARRDLFRPVKEESIPPRGTFAQGVEYLQQIISSSEPTLPTHQSSSTQSSQAIYQQLGIKPRPNPLSFIDPNLTPTRVSRTPTQRALLTPSAEGNQDIFRTPRSLPAALQRTPYHTWLSSPATPIQSPARIDGASVDFVDTNPPSGTARPNIMDMIATSVQAARTTADTFAGIVDLARMLATPNGTEALTANLTAVRASLLGPATTSPVATESNPEPSGLRVAADAIAIGQQILPHAIAAMENPDLLTSTIARTRQAIMDGLSGPAAPPDSPPTPFVDITASEHQQPPAGAPSLMQTATHLLGNMVRIIDDPYKAGQDLRRGANELLTGLTGEQRRASAAAGATSEGGALSFFRQLFTGLKNTASKKITELRLAGLAWTLAQKVEDMDESAAKNQIHAMIAVIARFQRKEIPLETLEGDLTRIMDGLDPSGKEILHVHLNGFELPIRTIRREAEGVAQDILDNIQRGHPLPSHEMQTKEYYERSVAIRQAQLVNNISTMAPINIVNIWFCNGLLEASTMAEILGQADRTSNTYHSTIRKALYKEIDKLPNPFLVKLLAKVSYWVISGLSSIILSSFIKGFLEKIQTSVIQDTAQHQQKLHNEIITGINTSLDVYNRGVEAVKTARSTRPDDNVNLADADTMLGVELARPCYNGKETKETLYNKAIDKAVNEILPSLGWRKAAEKSLEKIPIIAQALLFPVTSIAWITVAIAELISDWIIRFVIRNVVKSTGILDTVIDLSIDQVSRNGYSHAMNKLMLEQLKLIAEELDKSESAVTTSSVANQNELRKLAKNLFKTLETQRRESQVDSDAVTTLENIRRSIYQLTSDFSADAIALIIDQAKNIVLDPNMIAMRQDAVLEALNAALEAKTTATEPEMIALEDQIKKQSDIVLNKALKKIVHKTLQNTPEEVQKACKAFTDKLKETARCFVTQVRSQLDDSARLDTSIADFTATLSRMLNEAQNDPLLENYAASIDQSLITPIADLLQRVGNAIIAPVPRNQMNKVLDALENQINQLPEISHIDATIMGSVMENIERMTSQTAFIAGKEFFNEAWSLLTKKPVWRFAAHRAMLAFIGDKK